MGQRKFGGSLQSRFARSREESGMVIVTMAMMMTTLLVLAAVAIDGGNIKQVRRQAQSSVDLTALSAMADLDGTANILNEQEAVLTVKRYAYVNMGLDPSSWDNCDSDTTVPPGWHAPDNSGFPGFTNGNKCILINSDNSQIQLTRLPYRNVKSSFGGLVGITGYDISARATATNKPFTYGVCALCVVGTGTHYDGGNGDMNVSGDANAGVVINGNAQTKSNGSLSVITGGPINLFNGGTASGTITPAPQTFAFNFADPLAALVAPSTSGTVVLSGCSGPGIYTSIPTGCGALAPGLYIITGPTHISGSEAVSAAQGVTFYMTCAYNGGLPRPCSEGEEGADLVCTGQSSLDLKAPASGALAGMAMFFDRNNAGSLDCKGNGGAAITGTVYGASATLQMRGNGNCDLNSLVVVNKVIFDGNNAACWINYNVGENVRVPNIPPALLK